MTINLPHERSEQALDDLISTMIETAGLRRPRNAFFEKARACDTVPLAAALPIALRWEAMTKAFMFTTLSSVGIMARRFHGRGDADREVLGAIQTAYLVIGDDFANIAPQFNSVSPKGVHGVHYLWWADSISAPLRELADPAEVEAAAVLPPGVRGLLSTMDRLAESPLGAAVQLRVVEDIALDIAVAFRRLYSKVDVDGVRPFAEAGALDWIDSHIRAETEHAKSVSDHETGMTAAASTPSERAEMARLATEYASDWARALDEFAAALTPAFAEAAG